MSNVIIHIDFSTLIFFYTGIFYTVKWYFYTKVFFSNKLNVSLIFTRINFNHIKFCSIFKHTYMYNYIFLLISQYYVLFGLELDMFPLHGMWMGIPYIN